MISTARTAALSVAALVAAAVLAGCGSDAGTTGGNGYIDGDGTITVLPVGDRKKPGKVSGETLEGKDVALTDYAGKVVVINVWGSWCPPCRREAPALVEAANELAPKGVVFLGINTRDEGRDTAIAFQDKDNVPYSSIFDPGGRNLLAFNGQLSPNAIPTTLVIDANGRIAARVLGEVPSAQTLVDLVDEVGKVDPQ